MAQILGVLLSLVSNAPNESRQSSCDPDDVCGYSTVRLVKIRDRRLGFLYYGGVLCTLGYVIGYNIVYQQLYRQEGNVQGNVALNVETPDAMYSVDASATGFCLFPGSGPTGAQVSGGPPFMRNPCQYLDAYDAVYPGTEAGAVFVATRMTRSEQSLGDGCLFQPRRNCTYTTVSNFTSYTADIEFFKINIGHIMTVPDLNDAALSQSSLDMADGCITTGPTCTDGRVDPCAFYIRRGFACPPDISVGQRGITDKVALGTILQAAGIVSLDESAGEDSNPGPLQTTTLRNSGFTILMTVLYSNYYQQTATLAQGTIVYRYKVSLVRNEEFSGTENLPGPGSDLSNRTLVERHGVRIVMKQAGNVGAYNTAIMLISLTTSLSLLAIAKILVDALALYCMPFRHIYSQYVKVKTADFSDIEQLGPAVLEQFKSRDLVNIHPSVFGVVDREGHLSLDKAGRLEQEYEEGPSPSAEGSRLISRANTSGASKRDPYRDDDLRSAFIQ